ncbi:MAG: ATP-binding cassette domain-containing protein, partial [Burkholderiales bacterium]
MIRSERLEFGYQPGAPLSFPEVAIEQGQTLLLHGPSGCGKSTWLALAAGLVRPWRGRMQVAGQDMQALSG